MNISQTYYCQSERRAAEVGLCVTMNKKERKSNVQGILLIEGTR